MHCRLNINTKVLFSEIILQYESAKNKCLCVYQFRDKNMNKDNIESREGLINL